MSFWDLLKIEFMKVRRSKIVPLIFVAPLLVVISGVASLSNYFTPEITTNAWPAMFHSKCACLRLLSAPV